MGDLPSVMAGPQLPIRTAPASPAKRQSIPGLGSLLSSFLTGSEDTDGRHCRNLREQASSRRRAAGSAFLLSFDGVGRLAADSSAVETGRSETSPNAFRLPVAAHRHARGRILDSQSHRAFVEYAEAIVCPDRLQATIASRWGPNAAVTVPGFTPDPLSRCGVLTVRAPEAFVAA